MSTNTRRPARYDAAQNSESRDRCKPETIVSIKIACAACRSVQSSTWYVCDRQRLWWRAFRFDEIRARGT
jgi:hypothetical protein